MIKKNYLRMLMLGGILCVLPLTACDNTEEPTAEEGMAQNVPQAGEEDSAIPMAQNEGSMAEDSPAGTDVTEQEIPHSDVPPPSREVFTDAECDFEEWVGLPVDEVGVKDTGRAYRILTPDSMMTMDHNPERINVVHDADMKVTRVWCG